MPRGDLVEAWGLDPTRRRFERVRVPDWVVRLGLDAWHYREAREIPEVARKWLEAFRLFSITTRHYLRRRAWRYFRRLGRLQPARYVPAASRALILYHDDDVSDDLSLIDNWGLMHVLYHRDPILVPKRSGWAVAPNRAVDELRPAPIYERLWASEPRALVDLLTRARCGVVLRWAVAMTRKHVVAVRATMALDEQLALLQRGEPEVVSLAGELLRESPGLESFTIDEWSRLVRSSHESAVEAVSELIDLRCDWSRVSWDETVALSTHTSIPLARLGFRWLRAKSPAAAEVIDALPRLLEAEAEPVRREIAPWARELLAASPSRRTEVLTAFLEARHLDVRQEGWAWLRDEPELLDDVSLWRRLEATPYEDVRIALAAHWEERITAHRQKTSIDDDETLDAARMQRLWATVLLEAHGGSRTKPGVIPQILDRLRRRPSEAPELLQPLAFALGSSRGPEWRAGLAAVVRYAETGPAAAELVRGAFPELQFA